ncbi:hypothetical protein Pelo_464 [Pelomyxa schiedti]|nr:hypothetical protein Pelo_464 [Pelomyxa schiedti]
MHSEETTRLRNAKVMKEIVKRNHSGQKEMAKHSDLVKTLLLLDQLRSARLSKSKSAGPPSTPPFETIIDDMETEAKLSELRKFNCIPTDAQPTSTVPPPPSSPPPTLKLPPLPLTPPPPNEAQSSTTTEPSTQQPQPSQEEVPKPFSVLINGVAMPVAMLTPLPPHKLHKLKDWTKFPFINSSWLALTHKHRRQKWDLFLVPPSFGARIPPLWVDPPVTGPLWKPYVIFDKEQTTSEKFDKDSK